MRSFITAVALALTLVTTGALADETSQGESAYMPLRSAVALPGGWSQIGATTYVNANWSATNLTNQSLGVNVDVAIQNNTESAGSRFAGASRAARTQPGLDDVAIWNDDGDGSGYAMAYSYGDRYRQVVLIREIPGHKDAMVVITATGINSMDTMKVLTAVRQLASGVVIP